MPSTADPTAPPTQHDDDVSVGDVVDYVKAYVKQETIGPLKGAGRWLAFGLAGSFTLGLGLLFVLLGLLRLVQAEFESWATTPAWSWAAYLIVFAVSAILLFLTVRRIQKTYLTKESK